MMVKMADHDVYNQVQALGGNINGEGIIVEYTKTSGGEKTVGGEVVNAHENYDNSTNTRKVLIDFESHAGNWRLEAINGEFAVEVTLYKLRYEYDGFDKVGIDSKTRISKHDGVTKVINEKDW